MQALDFWNHPQWLGDSRDNPRDPNFEPFWMRDCAVEVKLPRLPKQWDNRTIMYGRAKFAGTLIYHETARKAYIPNYDCIIRWTNAAGGAEEVYATRGQRTYRPEGMTDYTIEADCNIRFFILKAIQ